MACENQRTVARQIELSGIGVHTGLASRISIQPGPPNSGIVFCRTDLAGRPEVPALLGHVVETELGTCIGKGEATVRTVEHVLAALAGQTIDNARIELEGAEPPILDGSFLGYFEALAEAGTESQDALADTVHIGGTIKTEGPHGGSYVALPDEAYRVSATIDFDNDVIGRQFGTFAIDEQSFGKEVAPARTFGFRSDAEELRDRGLALGASLDNTVVIDGDEVLNDGLRFPDEFLRHKVGDLVGDLALLGARFSGHVIAERPSHQGNVVLAKAVRAQHERSAHQHIVDVGRIMEFLPHRYPMLLVDRILELETGKRIVGMKNVTINEPFFQGHFPDHPIMPGVLIIEAMGQVGGFLVMDALENPKDKVMYFMALNSVKWRRPVIPGDQIVFELEMLSFRRQVCKMKGTATVDGSVVAEAELLAGMVDR